MCGNPRDLERLLTKMGAKGDVDPGAAFKGSEELGVDKAEKGKEVTPGVGRRWPLVGVVMVCSRPLTRGEQGTLATPPPIIWWLQGGCAVYGPVSCSWQRRAQCTQIQSVQALAAAKEKRTVGMRAELPVWGQWMTLGRALLYPALGLTCPKSLSCRSRSSPRVLRLLPVLRSLLVSRDSR